MSPTELYLQNERFIKQKAWQYHKIAPHVEVDELISEANLIFTKCINTFDPKRASFITHLGYNLDHALPQFLLFFSLDWIEIKDYLLSVESKTEEAINFDFWKNSLSQKAQEIIRTIFQEPLDSIVPQLRYKITKNSLKNHLKEKGWMLCEIDYCFDEISSALKNL